VTTGRVGKGFTARWWLDFWSAALMSSTLGSFRLPSRIGRSTIRTLSAASRSPAPIIRRSTMDTSWASGPAPFTAPIFSTFTSLLSRPDFRAARVRSGRSRSSIVISTTLRVGLESYRAISRSFSTVATERALSSRQSFFQNWVSSRAVCSARAMGRFQITTPIRRFPATSKLSLRQ
jgi:hypothetical protein